MEMSVTAPTSPMRASRRKVATAQYLPREEITPRAGSLRDRSEADLASALGWLGVGLGAACLTVPATVSRWIGANDSSGALQAIGLREMISGIGILSSRQPASWLWGRFAGDLIDLAFLAKALDDPQSDKARLVASALAVLGVTGFDLFCAERLAARPARSITADKEKGIRIHPTITVDASADELYRFWRDFENLPHIMRHLQSVEALAGGHSRWVAAAPAGMTVAWDAEITEDVPGERIAWRSLEGAAIANAGSVAFRPATGGRGTVIEVDMRYESPGGTLGAVVAFIFGKEPEQQVREDLRAYKAFVETGEVPTICGQSSARKRKSTYRDGE